MEHEILIGTLLKREEIENGIFEAIRLKLVAGNYLPDAAAIAPGTQAQQNAAWIAALATLRATHPDGKLIEVFNVGTSEARQAGKMNCIYIDYQQQMPGDIGGVGRVVFEKYDIVNESNFKWRKYKMPDRSYNLNYYIRYYTDSTAYDRIILGVIESALGSRRYLQGVKNDGTASAQKFLIQFGNYTNLSREKFLERLYSFVVPDVFLRDDLELIESNFPKATDIKVIADANETLLPSAGGTNENDKFIFDTKANTGGGDFFLFYYTAAKYCVVWLDKNGNGIADLPAGAIFTGANIKVRVNIAALTTGADIGAAVYSGITGAILNNTDLALAVDVVDNADGSINVTNKTFAETKPPNYENKTEDNAGSIRAQRLEIGAPFQPE